MVLKLYQLLEALSYDFSEALESITSFFDTFFNDIMNGQVVGLILYFWSCFPAFIRSFLLVDVILATVLVLYNLFRGDD